MSSSRLWCSDVLTSPPGALAEAQVLESTGNQTSLDHKIQQRRLLAKGPKKIARGKVGAYPERQPRARANPCVNLAIMDVAGKQPAARRRGQL